VCGSGEGDERRAGGRGVVVVVVGGMERAGSSLPHTGTISPKNRGTKTQTLTPAVHPGPRPAQA